MKLIRIYKDNKGALKFIKKNSIRTKQGLILKEGIRTTKFEDDLERSSFISNRDVFDWKYDKEIFYNNFHSEYLTHLPNWDPCAERELSNKVGGLKTKETIGIRGKMNR